MAGNGLINYPRADREGVRRWIPSWKLVLGSLLTAAAVIVVVFIAAVRFMPVPKPNDVARAETTIVYWQNGENELGRLGEANRTSVPLSDVPLPVQQAVLAAEDRSFYDHGGFSIQGTGRALWNNLTGGDVQGGSTITQQYAKNAYLSQERSYIRKLQELVLSVKLENTESKDQILEDYLNTIYFGRGAYGIQAASQAYFRVPVEDLSPRQGAVLAGLIQAPGNLDPEKNPQAAEQRWNYVLDGMVEQGWLTPAERADMTFPEVKPYKPAKNSFAGTNGYLLESVRQEMLAKGFSDEDLNIKGLRIVSSFNKNAQRSAVTAVETQGPTFNTEGLRIGLASVDPRTGEVVAMYGGQDYLDNQLNNATQAVAQAGSTFKAFGLMAGLQNGVSLNSVWDGNSPRDIQGYVVRNFGDASYGMVTLLGATEKSVNTAYVDMTVQVGPEKVKEAAIAAGLPADTAGLEADPSIVLGSSSPTALTMADAFGTFAARGVHTPATTIKSVSDGDGNVLYENPKEQRRAFDERDADLENFALSKVVSQGTAITASGLGRPAAGKTGTASESKAAWFVGYTPQLSTAVMMVKNDAKGNVVTLDGTGGLGSVTGGSFPTSIWTTYMAGALEGQPIEDFVTPEDAYAYGGGVGPTGTPTGEPTGPTDAPTTQAPTPGPTPTPGPPTPTPGPPTPTPGPTGPTVPPTGPQSAPDRSVAESPCRGPLPRI